MATAKFDAACTVFLSWALPLQRQWRYETLPPDPSLPLYSIPPRWVCRGVVMTRHNGISVVNAQNLELGALKKGNSGLKQAHRTSELLHNYSHYSTAFWNPL
jgi:hypothetical protein